MVNIKKEIGDLAESAALKFLVAEGLEFVQQNFACKSGEIDLIMRDQDCYVFVEVRYRDQLGFYDGLESVTRKKRGRIISAARNYLLKEDLWDKIECRFDVVAVNDANIANSDLEWVKDAFWAKW